MPDLDKLIATFEKFPGVGARQARRFAFHVLKLPEADTNELARLISVIKSTVVECQSCHRFFSTSYRDVCCSICTGSDRDRTRLLVVERDSDIVAIERSRAYDGLYFVLGGTVPLLHQPETHTLRAGALKATVETRLKENQLQEVILGFSINPDGENTARFVATLITPLLAATAGRISYLGRGLSTGSELEYADAETLKSALKNRV